MQIAFPFRIDRHGRVDTAPEDAHLCDMIEMVLFTRPGERVNLPDFGCGVQDLVFEPTNGHLVTMISQTTAAELQHWLGDRLDVEAVVVTPGQDGALSIEVSWRPVGSGNDGRRTTVFAR